MQNIQNRILLRSPSSEPAAAPRVAGKPVKVLLVNGDHKEAYLIRKTVAEAGAGAFNLEYTDRLSIGIERLARGGIDVLLLDTNVPDSRGFDSLAWGRIQATGVPVVILSARDDKVSETEALKKGAQEYLVKDMVDGDLLVRSLHGAIARQRIASEIARKTRRLETSEDNLHNIIKSSPDGIIIVDEGGIVRFVNPAVESFFGCKAEQLLGETIDFLPTAGGEKTELGIVREDGEKGVVEIQVVETQYQGKVAYLASLHDITERKRAEEEMTLAKEEAEARATSAEGAASIAEEESRLAREEVEAIKTVSEDAIAKAEEESRLVREKAEAVKKASEEAVATAKEKAKLAREEAKAAKKASEKAIAKAEEESRLAREEAKKEVKLAREEAKTARKASETAIAMAEEESRLAQQESLSAKKASEKVTASLQEKMHNLDPMQSEFMSNIVHELRAPLHSITGFTKLVLDGGVPDPATQQEFLTIIAEQSEHLRRLVDELVDISPVESGRMEIHRERVSATELLQSAVKQMRGMADRKNIIVGEDIPATLPDIEVDGQRLRQVIFNLLGNAIKFSEDGGSVSVRAEVRDGDLLVQVTDQGIGIAEEAMPFLFDRFFQAKNPAKVGGLGLGLYISKQIIEAHGGQIWAESTEGAGSIFSFTLPLEQPDR